MLGLPVASMALVAEMVARTVYIEPFPARQGSSGDEDGAFSITDAKQKPAQLVRDCCGNGCGHPRRSRLGILQLFSWSFRIQRRLHKAGDPVIR